jgi:hypothetical protein
VKHHPGPAPDHRPGETCTRTVTCKRTGPEVRDYAALDREGSLPYRQYTLADVRAWVEELYRLGAPDDLVLPGANGLTVTLDAGP